ncbi:MAG: FAD-dependent oxidoreductase, partial [Anaerolineaceae bacterium]|nr:FAD-dependent oxidoreductase [Anaerolineaceae bacterium]
SEFRIEEHPILSIEAHEVVNFYWECQQLQAYRGETIASALIANGIKVFGHHPKDGAPQGIFCANGQCAQCMVLEDGKPVKSCVELVRAGSRITQANGLSRLPEVDQVPKMEPISEQQVSVLIIGGGPAGLSAAIELGKLGVEVLLVDDKHRLGGKLVLQTHRFFGSAEAVYAGTRGIDIATRLETELAKYPTVHTWLHSTAVAVFSDQKVGVFKEGRKYVLVKPKVLLVTTGAREKMLTFKGNTLPGVFGAGAFQTLVNRDLVKPSQRLFIIGGGNVGLIAGYHALQAGIQVAGLVEVLPECGGYQVHKDKLVRMGVQVHTSHTVLSANGIDKVKSVTIAKVDERFYPIVGTEKTFECDSILIAVGLDPVNEFYLKAKEYGLTVFAAGDADEIAEASAAMFTGKIKGREIAHALYLPVDVVPEDWYRTVSILKSKPGKKIKEKLPDQRTGVFPVIHCTQEIPCNPCSTICPKHNIRITADDIRAVPVFTNEDELCAGCERCVAICPGLAITLVDYRKDPALPTVSIPFEFRIEQISKDERVLVLDTEGQELGELEVKDVISRKINDRTRLIRVQAPAAYAEKIAGVRIQMAEVGQPDDLYEKGFDQESIVCRCERVTANEIRKLIRSGYRDINEIKSVSRAGMGACGSKTCNALILRLFREEGIPPSEITEQSRRPLFVEVPLGIFAGVDQDLQG